MRLKTLIVKNFRALTNIDVEFSSGVSVIVGPNATGKTTILEAIRLAKALLAPRTPNEPTQTLISLGATSPHNPQQLVAEGLVSDPDRPLEIRCGYEITSSELDTLVKATPQIVTGLIQSRMGAAGNPTNITAFLSSPSGKQALTATEIEVQAGLQKIRDANNICRLDLIMDFTSSRINTPDPIGAALLAFLDSSLPPDKTKFSYFPADRALPRGEVGIQLGAQDAVQQLESHNSQPQAKYGRLKNTIFNTIVSSIDGRAILSAEFEKIFGGILKGRVLEGASLNPHGNLSIKVRDKIGGRSFDIDGLSSGEKGLVLTFLLIGRTLHQEGIVLLDEPELHLNPAVCKDLLPFIIDHYVVPKNLQLIICSHSPEILAGAFDKENCTLYHLVSGSLLTPVRQSDAEEIAEALRRLGTSESEGLLYKATIFVEGEHDVEILETGFGSLLRQYKLKDLGGRNEIEKQIKLLQAAERSGERQAARYFVFDKDEAPTNLSSTYNVRVLQWNRRCLENYLIDIDRITDLLQDENLTKIPVNNTGEISALLKGFAMEHLNDAVIKLVYDSYEIPNAGRRPEEVEGKEFRAAAEVLFSRIN